MPNATSGYSDSHWDHYADRKCDDCPDHCRDPGHRAIVRT
jgi:hypothetical protein